MTEKTKQPLHTLQEGSGRSWTQTQADKFQSPAW